MPRKPSTTLVMKDYPPLSTRRTHVLAVEAVTRLSKAAICFELALVDEPQQAGRRINHELPAVLTPTSPLARFLRDGFGVELKPGQSLELGGLAGRRVFVRFAAPGSDGSQRIQSVKPCPVSKTGPSPTNE